MTFKKAVESAAFPLNRSYQPGLQALQKYSKKIQCDRPIKETISGSVDIDSSLMGIAQHASANRWDYGVGYKVSKNKECAVWIEVHGAVIDEVGKLIRKVTWLKEYLKVSAPDLWRLTVASPNELRFVWLGTKDVHISKNSPDYRRIMQAGITLHGTVLTLP